MEFIPDCIGIPICMAGVIVASRVGSGV